MNKEIMPGSRYGKVNIIASKSQAHRQLICAALYGHGTKIFCNGSSKDIEATKDCLKALGCDISTTGKEIKVIPGIKTEGEKELYCNESGSTLRFMIPILGALGLSGTFYMEGRLSERPLGIFKDELEAHGMKIVQDGKMLHCSGKLSAGRYTIPGNISSQYISGLLMALPLLEEKSSIEVTGDIESEDYINMTLNEILAAGVEVRKDDNVYYMEGKKNLSYPESVVTEGDWSNATFFLCMGALSKKGITVEGLMSSSAQGDKKVIDILIEAGAVVDTDDDKITVKRGELNAMEIDARGIPDMIPALSALAAVSKGRTEIKNASRLRMKESDRLKAVFDMLTSLSADVIEKEDGLIIDGNDKLSGGRVLSYNDHRIAMATAVCACAGDDKIILEDAGCVAKSYPDFWDIFDGLEIEERI